MEYTYQNSSSDKPSSAFLNEHNLTLRSSGEDNTVPYSMITEVKLMKDSDKEYKTILRLNGGKSITIFNKYYTDKKPVDRSREYSTFVRVLHFHLKDKSKAVFTSGNPVSKTWNWLTFSVIISFTADYFGVSLVNPFIQAAVLIVMMGIIILAMNMGRWPRHYLPTNIPLEFLP